MRAILVDSSFWIALRNKTDHYHQRARELAAQWMSTRTQLVVTPLIFAEVYAHFSRSLTLRERIMRDFWENPAVQIEIVEAADMQEALGILRQCRDKTYSFCDAVSFAIIRRLSLEQAASFDDHFQQFGPMVVLK